MNSENFSTVSNRYVMNSSNRFGRGWLFETFEYLHVTCIAIFFKEDSRELSVELQSKLKLSFECYTLLIILSNVTSSAVR